jgi:anti-sigma regulatory factor (Ser/Thr protein kinase)
MSDIGPQPFQHRLTLSSDPSSIDRARTFVEGLLKDAGAPAAFVRQMGLVVDEAIANAVSHGGSASREDVALSCQLVEGRLQILVEDFQGRLFDPEYFRRIAVVKDWGKGGRGILLMEKIMDRMSYLIEEGKHTVLYLEKALPPAEKPAPAPAQTAPPAR